jgi:DTW domain-containing protein YfiP
MKCPRCLLLQRLCLCAEVPVVATRTRVVIIRHQREEHRSSNTGRLAHMALQNSEIVAYGSLTGYPRLPPLRGAWLLFPEGEERTQAPEPPPEQLIVLDATWSQARKMYRKIEQLRGVPTLRLPERPRPTGRLREAPSADRVSTIEAIAEALRLLEGDAVAEPLETLFGVAVNRARATGRTIR